MTTKTGQLTLTETERDFMTVDREQARKQLTTSSPSWAPAHPRKRSRSETIKPP